MEPLRKSEFWEETINHAARRANKMQVRLHYRPVGFMVTVSILAFLQFSQMGIELPVALLLAALVALLNVIFN